MTAAELSGDATTSGSNAVTVTKLNGTSLAGLATGLLKNTTSTGVPSIATAGTDYAAANAATTPNGQTCTLGSTCNVNSGAAAHSVSINEGAGSAIAGATIGTGGRVLTDQGASADPAFKTLSQDVTMTSGGAVTVGGINAVPLCTGFTPTTGQALTYTTASSPNPMLYGDAAAEAVCTGYPNAQCLSCSLPHASPMFTWILNQLDTLMLRRVQWRITVTRLTTGSFYSPGTESSGDRVLDRRQCRELRGSRPCNRTRIVFDRSSAAFTDGATADTATLQWTYLVSRVI